MAFAAVERLYLSVSCQVLCVLLHVSDRRDQKPAAQGSPTPKPRQTPIRVRGRLAWTRGAVRGAEGGAGAVANSPVTARRCPPSPALSWPGRRQPAHAQLCTTLRSHAGPSLGPRSSVPAPLPLWSCLETPAALDFSGRPALPFPFSEHPSRCRVSASGCAAWGPSAQRCLGLSQSPLRYPRLRGWVPSCLMSRA